MRRRLIVLIRVALLVPACGGDEGPPEACADPIRLTTVRLEDFAFRPDCLTAAPAATIRLENEGDAPHTFTIAGTDIDFVLKKGESVASTLGDVDTGRYSVTCTLHPQMEATLTIA